MRALLLTVALLVTGGARAETLDLRLVDESTYQPLCDGAVFSLAGKALPAAPAGEGTACAWHLTQVPLPDGQQPLALTVRRAGFTPGTVTVERRVFEDKVARRMLEGMQVALQVDPFSGWDLAERLKAWDGAWVLEAGSLGHREAWEVSAGKVRAFSGEAGLERSVTLSSPCTAEIGGADGGYVAHYTLLEGRLVTGLGDAGERRGGRVVACVSNGVFTLEGGRCSRWDKPFGKWRSAPATCAVEQGAHGEVFSVELYAGRVAKVPLVGEALLDEQLQRAQARPFPSLAAARAALARP